jgi:GABA(A) receptor-associated protein
MENFKKIDFQKRKNEAVRIKKKYPNSLPIIIHKNTNSEIQDIKKHKYLVPSGLTVAQLLYVIRKRIKLKPETALFIYVNNKIPSSNLLISQLYEQNKDKDEFLYIEYSGENVFG